MNVLHVCLANFYVEGYGYQENILPRMHKKMGHNVKIIASTEKFIDNCRIGYTNPESFINEDGIPVVRLPYKKYIPKRLIRKLRYYDGLMKEIESFKPEIIFLHNLQFGEIKTIIKYVEKNKTVKVYGDNHADYINSAHGWISRRILHGCIYKKYIHLIMPYLEKYYGTLPLRVEFINDVYGIPMDKLEYLPLGVDDDMVSEICTLQNRNLFRKNYDIKETDFLIISGGKINETRLDILKLFEAVKQLGAPFKILFFGSFTDSVKNEVIKYNEDVIFYGWANERDTYNIINAADLAVYPCLHSTLWETTVGVGVPCIFHKMKGIDHVSDGKNAILLEDISIDALIEGIKKCYKNYAEMKEAANMIKHKFSYYNIAKKSIEQ